MNIYRTILLSLAMISNIHYCKCAFIDIPLINDDGGFLYISPKNDGSVNDYAYLDANYNTVEVYDHFYITFEESINKNDQDKNIKMSKAEFMSFCVQASKAKDLDKVPFQELLQKIEANDIDIKNDTIFITEKDFYYRLLTYIPAGKFFILLNNKQVTFMLMGFETEEDLKREPEYYFCGSKKYKRIQRSGEELRIEHYDFNNAEHYQQIYLDFNNLLNKDISFDQ